MTVTRLMIFVLGLRGWIETWDLINKIKTDFYG